MKLAKMSLVAALALTANMYAIDNVKVNGDAKLYYGTTDSDAAAAADMFNEAASYTNFALHLGLTADLTEGVSAGVGMQTVATLGVENNLVDNTWSGAHGVKASRGASFAGGAEVEPEMWVDEAWIAGTAFDTTLKLGRQALDTPLAFTETWGVDKNTFEAGVIINQSIPDTTLVATSIGKSNGSADEQRATLGNTLGADYVGTYAAAGYVAGGGQFSTFGNNGTFAFGAVNNSIKPLTVQAWYYDMQTLAKAYWLQADLNMDGVLFGAQYANTDAENIGTLASYLSSNIVAALPGTMTDVDDTDMYSVMIGYAIKDVVTVKAAYSSVSDDGTLGMANTATGAAATIGGASKMYTEMWWNYGNVSAVGADSFSVTAEGTVGPDVKLFAGYFFSDIDSDENSNAVTLLNADKELTEVTFTASKSFGPLDASLALIFADTDYDDAATEDVKSTDIQVYLTYNF